MLLSKTTSYRSTEIVSEIHSVNRSDMSSWTVRRERVRRDVFDYRAAARNYVWRTL